MIRWTGLAPWEFECSFPGSLISTFLVLGQALDLIPPADLDQLASQDWLTSQNLLDSDLEPLPREEGTTETIQRRSPERQGHLALTVLYVPSSGLDCLICAILARRKDPGHLTQPDSATRSRGARAPGPKPSTLTLKPKSRIA